MEVARIWRQRKQRYSMEGSVCNHCGAAQFPARPVCRQCGSLINAEPLMNESQIRMTESLSIRVNAVAEQSRG